MSNILSISSGASVVKKKGIPKVVTDNATLQDVIRILDPAGTETSIIKVDNLESFSIDISVSGGDLDECELQHSFDGANWATVEDSHFAGMISGECKTLENYWNSRSLFRVRANSSTASATVVLNFQGVVRR